MKVRNSINVRDEEKTYKTFTQESKTVPDEAMSIRQILERYASGLPLPITKTPIYSEDNEEDGINPKTLDLVDIQEMSEFIKDVKQKTSSTI